MREWELPYKDYTMRLCKLGEKQYRVLVYRREEVLPCASVNRKDPYEAKKAAIRLTDQIIFDEKVKLLGVIWEIECTRDR